MWTPTVSTNSPHHSRTHLTVLAQQVTTLVELTVAATKVAERFTSLPEQRHQAWRLIAAEALQTTQTAADVLRRVRLEMRQSAMTSRQHRRGYLGGPDHWHAVVRLGGNRTKRRRTHVMVLTRRTGLHDMARRVAGMVDALKLSVHT